MQEKEEVDGGGGDDGGGGEEKNTNKKKHRTRPPLVLFDLDQTILSGKTIGGGDGGSQGGGKEEPEKFDFECSGFFKHYGENTYYHKGFMVRPGVREFIAKCKQQGWDMGIWSASIADIVDAIEGFLFKPILFPPSSPTPNASAGEGGEEEGGVKVEIEKEEEKGKIILKVKYSREHCQMGTPIRKYLSKLCQDLGYEPDEVVLIDDNEQICNDNGPPYHVMHISPWFPNSPSYRREQAGFGGDEEEGVSEFESIYQQLCKMWEGRDVE